MAGNDSGREFYSGILDALTGVLGSAKGYLHEARLADRGLGKPNGRGTRPRGGEMLRTGLCCRALGYGHGRARGGRLGEALRRGPAERWDGRVYPEGLVGEYIRCNDAQATVPRFARDRICARGDSKRARGQFGPEAADGFLSILEEIFLGIHRSRAVAFRGIPERVETPRLIDPLWFTSGPSEAT